MTDRPPEEGLDRIRRGLAGRMEPTRIARALEREFPVVDAQPAAMPPEAAAAQGDPSRAVNQ